MSSDLTPSPADTADVVFTMTANDLAALYDDWAVYSAANHLERREPLRMFVWRAGFTAALIGAPLFIYRISDSLVAATAAVCAVILGARWFVPKWARRKALPRMAWSWGADVQYGVGLSEEGLRGERDEVHWTYFWSNITDIAVTDRNILFVLETSGPPTACPVPTRAFADAEQARRFVELAGDLWKRAARTDKT